MLLIVGGALKDSINPCALMVLVLFIFLCQRYAYDSRTLLSFAFKFITSFATIIGVLNMGFFDLYLAKGSVPEILTWSVLAIAAFYCLYGFSWLYRWWNAKGKNVKDEVLINPSMKPIIQWSFWMKMLWSFGVFLLVCVLGALNSLWPADKSVIALSHYMAAPGLEVKTGVQMLLYGVLYCAPLMVVYQLFQIRLMNTDQKNEIVPFQVSSMMAMTNAGMCLSVGIGLIFTFL